MNMWIFHSCKIIEEKIINIPPGRYRLMRGRTSKFGVIITSLLKLIITSRLLARPFRVTLIYWKCFTVCLSYLYAYIIHENRFLNKTCLEFMGDKLIILSCASEHRVERIFVKLLQANGTDYLISLTLRPADDESVRFPFVKISSINGWRNTCRACTLNLQQFNKARKIVLCGFRKILHFKQTCMLSLWSIPTNATFC